MSYRIDEIMVPDGEPFLHDRLNRPGMVGFLEDLIEKAGSPFVLAMDAPWGSGKSTLIQMLKSRLELKKFACVYFNAWQVDYITDPLVALVSCLVELDLRGEQPPIEFSKSVKSLRRITSLLAKRGALFATKALTPGGIDLSEEIKNARSEITDTPLTDIVDTYLVETHLLSTFSSELTNAAAYLAQAHEGKPLIFFIDELDRCRPTFAIELLERVKHLLNVKDVVFVFAIDKPQLEASIRSIYGVKFDATEYLRRFIDVDFGIPAAKNELFTRSLITRIGLDDLFSNREGQFLRDKDYFIETLSKLSSMTELTLRGQEKCITRLKIVMDQTPSNHFLDPILIALLILLRTKFSEMFFKLAKGEVSSDEVMTFLSSLLNGSDFVASDVGMALEAHLIWSDINTDRQKSKLDELRAEISSNLVGSPQLLRAEFMMRYMGSLSTQRMSGTDIQFVARKIDFAASIRD